MQETWPRRKLRKISQQRREFQDKGSRRLPRPSFPHPIQRPRTTETPDAGETTTPSPIVQQKPGRDFVHTYCTIKHTTNNTPTAESGPQSDERASRRAINQSINRLLHAHAPYRTKRNQPRPPAHHRLANHQLRYQCLRTSSRFTLRTTT